MQRRRPAKEIKANKLCNYSRLLLICKMQLYLLDASNHWIVRQISSPAGDVMRLLHRKAHRYRQAAIDPTGYDRMVDWCHL